MITDVRRGWIESEFDYGRQKLHPSNWRNVAIYLEVDKCEIGQYV